MHDATVVPPIALLLFGGAIEVKHRERTVEVDGWIRFEASLKTGVLFKELRRALQGLLLRKLQDPRFDAAAEPIARAIIALIRGDELGE